jgi:glycosyltransferase involved in cell wall biosynthesis
MIRVCYMVDAAFLGGAELYVSQLATALDPDEFEASVIVRTARHPDLEGWVARLRETHVRVLSAPMNLPYHPSDAVSILRVLDSVGPHVVHVNMPGPHNGQNALLVPLARLGGARTVVTEHLPMVEGSRKRAALKSLAYRWLDCAITVSRANVAFLRELQGVETGRIRMVHNGIVDVPAPEDGGEATRRELGAARDEALIWFVGNLLPHKGLCDLIRALSMSGRKDWRLAVLGDGPERYEAERLAAGAGIIDRVAFLGRRPPEAVRAMLPAGDVLALPSHMEGLPYTVLEAMAARLPVISCAVFGIPEAVRDGETGLLVAPGDVPALSRALDALLEDAAMRRRMGAGRASNPCLRWSARSRPPVRSTGNS